MKRKRIFFLQIIVALMTIGVTCAQKKNDTLLNKSYDELISKFYGTNSFNEALPYAQAFIRKSKQDKDSIRLSAGYYIIASKATGQLVLNYTDSVINITKNNGTIYQPTATYLLKAGYYRDELDFPKSLDNIFLAKEYSLKYYNPVFLRQCQNLLGTIKISIGDFKEALVIFREDLKNTTKDTINKKYSAFLESIYNMASVYNETQMNDSATYYNNIGLRLAREKSNQKFIRYFEYNIGITLFNLQKYEESKSKMEKASSFFKEIDDKLNEIESIYYLGKIHKTLGQFDQSYKYFNRIDSIYIVKNNFYPKFRDVYYELINLSREREEPNKQIEYTNKLLTLDSLFLSSNLYLNSVIKNKFDLPELILEKEALIYNLELKNRKTSNKFLLLTIGVIVLTILLIHQIYLRYRQKQKAKEIIREYKKGIDTSLDYSKGSSINTKEKLHISKEIVSNVLNELELFEKEKGFLKSDLTLQQLAKQVKSNSKYLSKIINNYKHKSFNNYINELRINCAMDRLRKERKFRNFTIKAIALESGYNQPESFSRAFIKHTGTKPSYYIIELQKTNN